MKRLLLTIATGLILTTSAFADTHSGAMKTYQFEQLGDLYASELIGMRVYSAESDFDSFEADTILADNAEQNWDDIGEVNEVILSRDGSVKALILGVGGFIGIGEKDVAVDMSSIKIVNENDNPGDFFLVVSTDVEALTEAPEYERQSAMSEAESEVAKTGITESTRTILGMPQVEREGYTSATIDQLTTEDLTGARLYSVADEDIGEVDQLLLDDNGEIKQVVLDIGGFLGLGEHRIAVTMDELNILRNDDGDDLRVYIEATQEELEAQPGYEG